MFSQFFDDVELRRFWSKVDASGVCWEWTAGLTSSGYGKFFTAGGQAHGRTVQAHRFAYESLIGSIPDGYQSDHICRNRPCVNPDHLEIVLPDVNNARSGSPSAMNARKTHCPRGHLLAGANVYILPNGARSCRECQRAASRAWKQRQRELGIL